MQKLLPQTPWLFPPAVAALLFVESAAGQGVAEVELELLWERGGVGTSPETEWVQVTGGAILHDAVYIVDIRDPSVRQFDLQGSFLANLGRHGAGPGEYERPSSISARGDSVAVWDFVLRRVVLFNQDAQHLATRQLRPFPSGRYGSIGRLFTEADGRYTAILSSVVDRGQVIPGALIGWSESGVVDTVAVLREEPLMGLIGDQWNRVSWWGSLGPVVSADRAGSRFVVVDGITSTLTFHEWTDGSHRTNGPFSLPGAAKTLSEREQERLIAALTADVDPAWEEFRAPPRLPAWSGVLASGKGLIWLRRGGTGENFGNSEHWVLWSEEEGVIGAVTLGPRETLLDVANDLVLASRLGDYNEAYVRLYLARRPQ